MPHLTPHRGTASTGDPASRKFTPETPELACDLGPNFYDNPSRGDVAGQEGRRVQIVRMRGGKYLDMPFNRH